MIRFLTAGESHGKALTAILEGLPSNLPIDIKYINRQLKRRQHGYGRGMRMKIESDSVEILSGIRNGKTIGSPVSLLLKNKDWDNWKEVMDEENIRGIEKVIIPRPGHADLTGTLKYNFDDIRNSIERSSARETAARTAAGSFARILLEYFNIYTGSYVESIGGIYPERNFYDKVLNNRIPTDFSPAALSAKADKSNVRVLEPAQEKKIISRIKRIKKEGDTLGGTFVVIIAGVPPGLGSFMHYDRKLDADLAWAVMTVNAVKAVMIGAGFAAADKPGSKNNDEIILRDENFSRRTNFSGGIEGGISSGMPILIRAAMKPISTLMKPVKTIDLKTMKAVAARRERSDFTAVPACSVIAESAVSFTLAQHFLQKFGGDSIEEINDNYKNFTNKLYGRVKKNFR